ncbi:MAG: FMN-binding glutamate synthase family protein [Proteobacteria bacterium]|nr:MAG: FMN-binding glutamate synthase family protein [Pseudomonadota bacterium]
MRNQAKYAFALLICVAIFLPLIQIQLMWISLLLVSFVVLGLRDMQQARHAIRRNYPILGHFRYLLESIRPEINQYFVESNTNGMPFNREIRSIIYQRAKKQNDAIGFGTRHDVYANGHECITHTMFPSAVVPETLRTTIGGPHCKQPYNSSIFIVSGMSFGSLSGAAIEALNKGAKLGEFIHNSGEGGISEYHRKHGGDLIWQIGTGYFGCRDIHGRFSREKFIAVANDAQVKMIEIKISQGAKPGLGGMLPGGKITEEISLARGVPLNVDVISPGTHSEFSSIDGLLDFIEELRDLSHGKPIGVKLCLGSESEFEQLCKEMVKKQIVPDFISLDGAEGGTGSSSVEFTNHVGLPLYDALFIINKCLKKYSLREDIKIIASGKITDGFDIIKTIAQGSDLCASARGMMMALGCIQALKCESNKCPVGIATQNPSLTKGLVPAEKSARVYSYHKKTIDSVAKMLSVMGLTHTSELRPFHILKRNSEGHLTSAESASGS